VNVSFQLYSAREVASQSNFLKALSELGYNQVEGYGGVYSDAAAYRKAMDDVGLSMMSGHFALTDLENDFDGQLEIAKTLGMKHMYVPHLAPADRPTDSAGYKAVADRLTALNAKVKDAGLGFGWHNHDFELMALSDGGIPLEIILNEAPDIAWEGDLAWVAVAGSDPFEWVKRYGPRLTAVHVKDIAPNGEKADEDGWADVGEGVIDWKSLTALVRAEAPNALMIMEHDKPSDANRFARTSINNFNSYTS